MGELTPMNFSGYRDKEEIHFLPTISGGTETSLTLP